MMNALSNESTSQRCPCGDEKRDDSCRSEAEGVDNEGDMKTARARTEVGATGEIERTYCNLPIQISHYPTIQKSYVIIITYWMTA